MIVPPSANSCSSHWFVPGVHSSESPKPDQMIFMLLAVVEPSTTNSPNDVTSCASGGEPAKLANSVLVLMSKY